MANSAFDDHFVSVASPTLNQHLGRTVTYRDPKGVPVTITARVGEVRQEQFADDRGGLRWESVRGLTLLRSDVADPTIRAEVDIGTETWAVSTIDNQSESESQVTLVRRTTAEVSRAGLRSVR